MRRVATYIQEYGGVSTLHGVAHIIAPNRHPCETYLWLVVTVVGIVLSTVLNVESWLHYYSNPTVLSLEKNYRAWQIPFPTATLCLLDKVNRTMAIKVIYRLWGLQPKDQKFDYYMRFVQSVANLTYDNLHDFVEFKDDKDLYTIDMAALASKVQINMTYSAYIFNRKYNRRLRLQETITEMGICYSYSGALADYISLSKNVKTKFTNDFQPPSCNFLNSLCYARIEDLPGTIRYYIHSPYEVPDLSSSSWQVWPGRERDTSFRFLQTVASPDLRSLYPRQRYCRFTEEPWPHMASPVYSFNLCRMNCRKRLAFDKCGCAPYFYMRQKGIPVCSVRGLSCLANHTHLITTLLRRDGTPHPCPCPLPCNDIQYYVDHNQETDRSYPVPCNIRFRWAIEVYSKTRVRRDIIFGLEDLLVSIGGTAAFFLGCSVMTLVELFYFFTLRVFWFLQPEKKKQPPRGTRAFTRYRD